MTEAQVWLAPDAYERLQAELRELLRQRGASGTEAYARDSSDQNTDQQILTDQRERENRIRKLQELLQNPIVGENPPDDGVAEPGMVVTVRWADEEDTETFLLAHREEGAYSGVEICSTESPLGRALTGAREGETCEYTLPDGRTMQVTLERAVPYGAGEPSEATR